MATINTIEDLIRLLDENPEWVEALRSRILTRELLELPARFAEYTEANDVRMTAVEARLDRLEQTLADFMEATARQFEIVNAHLASLDRRMDQLDRRMGRFERDMGWFRARHAAETVSAQSTRLARDLGYRWTRTLTIDDLYDMVDESDTRNTPVNTLRSFRRADMIMDVVKIDTGEPCYIAVEVSYTVNGRDIERAIRNAEMLTMFTGKDALPVIAGARKDDRVDADIASGNVVWFEIEDESLETE